MDKQTKKTVLILGANGRLGRCAAHAFADAGWDVLAQARRPIPELNNIRHIGMDLGDTGAIVAAATGASAVVYAVNPVYTEWDKHLLPLARQGMAIAEQLGALFMLPGNVYAYGKDMPALLRENTLQRPSTTKGRQRRHLEYTMQSRARHGLRSVVIRAGDFFGAGKGNWFDQAIVKSLADGKLVYPGPLGKAHAWAYLPDLARAFVGVAELDRNGRFDPVPHGAPGVARAGVYRQIHFSGHTFTGQELLDLIEQAARELGVAPQGRFRRRSVPWTLIRLVGLFNPMWRELAKMAYLWRVSHGLDGRVMHSLLPDLPHTPPERAIRDALLALGHGTARPGSAAVPIGHASPASLQTS